MLTGKVIVVTGGGGGIGEAAVRVFAGYGARLMIGDIDRTSVEASATLAERLGAEAVGLQVDVTNEGDVMAMIEQTVERFGRLDGAFNNAGVGCPPARTADQDIGQFRRVLEIDLIGVWYCIKHEIKAMLRTGGGAIVNNASDAGLSGTPHLTPYAAAKAALINMTRTAAMEYGEEGIRINAVCPGPISTPALKLGIEKGELDFDVLMRGMAMRRLGEPEEVAELAAWLLSSRASYVTGQPISVDGGFNTTFS